jgi:SAM-dependent methyltransferase
MANSPTIFDRKLIRVRARRAFARDAATFLLERVAADLADRLETVLRTFPLAADVGTPADAVRRALAGRSGIETMVAVAAGDEGFGADDTLKIVADEEFLPLAPAAFDLAVSALALQGVNDLPGTLIQIRRALKPDGLFLAALLGGDTLTELRESFFAAEAEIEGGASPRVAPFLEVREAGALLQRAGFALPVVDVERVTVRYASPFALMRDLRAMGATNPLQERRRKPLKRATLFRMAQIYAERFSDADGKVRATFDIVWLSGWAPHESQQKPLAPGSAKRRLADALGTSELPAGDKTGG